MVKRHGFHSIDTIAAPDAGGGEVWRSVGRRLEQRRKERGHSLDRVAKWAGITVEACQSYERGAPIPALELAQIAELLTSPVSWFFEEVAQDDDPAELEAMTEPASYQVATIEHRIQILAESFRRLDFERQQHLLAISRALSRG
ncbi:MAG TPA: helix-turn-helix domain-containing protein [Hyphomicrobiaceae bacterium]|nr:helix-turn-helix domain-containing protein [Hyphomicrobiaceae bacterium]